MRAITLIAAILLLSAMSFAQTPFRNVPGFCPYGCGPYIPLITTPVLSLETMSPNPTGATNATGGLIAGASNSTLSTISKDLDAVYTVPVWVSGGGTPLISPAVTAGREVMRMGRAEQRRMARPPEAEGEPWVYFSATEAPVQPMAKGPHPAVRVYTNADVQRQNQQNGLVKYDNKTERIQ